jgi:hypothetical protein
MHASRANKSRNAKRAAHAQAVIEDLIESCTSLAIAEYQTNPSTSNVKGPDVTDDGELIYNAITKHLKSLPLRYALSIEVSEKRPKNSSHPQCAWPPFFTPNPTLLSTSGFARHARQPSLDAAPL